MLEDSALAVPQEDTFTLPELARISKAEYRTLHTWLRRGLLAPSRQGATGSGSVNLFSTADALEACMLADLRRAGLGLSALERLAQALRERPQRLAGDELLLLNGSVTVLASYSLLPEAVAAATPALVYDVGRARDTLEASRTTD